MNLNTEEQQRAVGEAERRIQAILLDLHNEHGVAVEALEVDTRTFGNLAVSIVTA